MLSNGRKCVWNEKEMKKVLLNNENDIKKYLNKSSEFKKAVLCATFRIPKGKISTYKRIAKKIGNPCAFRAVGTVLHNNPLAPIVPCHRVVRSDGKISGEEHCVENRRHLLIQEGIPLKENKVMLNEDILLY